MSERKEVMWCTVCGARFAQEEIKGWGCPKCGNKGVPCGCNEDTTVEVNWHELRILTIWAENWAHHIKKDDQQDTDSALVVQAIARRMQLQRPQFPQLTLTGEIAALPADLAKSGIKIGNVETNIPKPDLLPVNGPGAVGYGAPTA